MSASIKRTLNNAIKEHKAGRSLKALALINGIQDPQNSSIDTILTKGSILRSLKRHAAAEVCYQQALVAFANNKAVLGNYGNLLSDCQRFAESEQAFLKILSSNPNDSATLRNLGLMYYHSDQPQKSLECFEYLIKHNPNDDDAIWHRALAHLQLGQFKQGWQDYETRLITNKEVVKEYPGTRWRGQDISGKTLFIYLEQGLGDAIQFLRYVPKVQALNIHIKLQVKAPLQRLMQTMNGVELIAEKQKLDNYDFYCSLLSLPALLGLSTEEDQYLPVNLFNLGPISDEHTLPKTNKRRIAIAWGSKLKPKDRTCPLDRLAFLAHDPNIELYSIQVDHTKNDIEKNLLSDVVTDLSPRISDFYDTAQFLKQMDLVVSVDSSPIHLAGTLGIKTYGLLLHYSDWRWLYQRYDSPLYPSVELFRQAEPGDWTEPLKNMKLTFDKWKR
jgi:Flp pilus assembly protein TadD